MHDLVHDLAQSIMGDECRLRTYTFPDRVVSWLSFEFTKFSSFRVLDASGTYAKQLSPSIGSLKHLRCLNLSRTHICTLPKAICDLWNLQILNSHRLSISQELTCLKTLSFFVVGKLKGCQLSELKDLDLGGQLRVENLERVGNLMDAQRVNFIGKPNLRHLDLSWESGCELRENVEQVLEGLKRHPNLERLGIRNYNGTHFPLWMGDSILRNLSDITLSNCPNCLQLLPLGQLPSLRWLSMDTMNALEYIDNEFHGRAAATRRFLSLEVLKIGGLLNLTGLFKDERIELFPRLHKMRITNCPKLMLPCLPSLKELRIVNCSEVLLSSISNLSTLISLDVVFDNHAVVSFPEKMLQNLTVLETLKIRGYTKLKVLPKTLANLISLKSIDIDDCPKLESLLEQSLPQSLQRLKIERCHELKSVSLQHLSGLETFDSFWGPELRSLPASLISLNVIGFVSFPVLQNLTALESLKIEPFNKLQVLPTALANLTSLKSLHISSCSELESLPEQGLRGLQSLRRLEIINCCKLKSLSEGLQHLIVLEKLIVSSCPKLGSLPAGIQSLTKLHLDIYSCPELARRCEKGKGEDWYKIAHLPPVYIR
ncbi:hypothetical protein F0562_024387 [Nyssa sinensis]|uniref:R13L1/DRL21-like LRR repeat region domain-containing protein n=1 Tax=Nyssa sinensis TaxID=561372 RepID=A0A5J5BDF8_9ASTE|nr:hypothetical protein F0562_024387 [Nyssa sinensis]